MEADKLVKLAIVVPCYNEEEVLPETVSRLTRFVDDLKSKGKAAEDSAIYFVDDGRQDSTWSLIQGFADKHDAVKGVKLSRNRGHQNALLAGLHVAKGDAIISIDADLQDDIQVMETMVDRFVEGNDVVYGVRSSREKDSFFKRSTAQLYYKVLHAFGVEVVFDHADYRLLSRRALNDLKSYSEVNFFLRGVVPTLGYKSCKVTYARQERFAGESKYPLRKMLALALDGITSFSAVPLKMIAALGVIMFLVSLGISIWAVGAKLFSDGVVPGWTSSVLPMYLLGGIQLLSLGVVGEYVAKIYMETKRRPRYFIEEEI